MEVTPKKTGRKVTDIEISFDYKNNKTRIARNKKKRENFVKAIIDIIQDNYIGKTLKTKNYGHLICQMTKYDEIKDKIILTCEKKDNINERIDFFMDDFNSLKLLEKTRKKAEAEFYINEFIKNDVEGKTHLKV